MASKVIEKINEYSSRRAGVSVELSGLGSAIELCFKVAQEVQSKFQHGLHQITETSLHWTRRVPGGPKQRETLDERTKLDEGAVETLLRFEPAESRTMEGKFNFLMAQEKHVLTPCVTVTLSTQKLDTFHSGYQRPKVPV